ncbi:MAG: hypothetical protein ACKOEG_14080 [Chthoniobacterales bacterium]
MRQIPRKRGTRWVMQAVRCVINTGPSRRFRTRHQPQATRHSYDPHLLDLDIYYPDIDIIPPIPFLHALRQATA